MGVVTPERPAAPQEPPPRRGIPTSLVVLAAVILSGYLFIAWVSDLIPDVANPFTSETVDRTGPAVLRSIQNLEDFRAASGHFEVIVDLEKDTRFVPSPIRGERVLFVAVGDVEAGVDFSGVKGDAVRVSNNRRSVDLELPHAEFFGARVDPGRSYVYDRDRGLIDRVASIFQDNPTSEQELYVLAEEKLMDAAENDSGILARAERNTRLMLLGLFEALGFTSVSIEFVDVAP
jgi:hypothetical protein